MKTLRNALLKWVYPRRGTNPVISYAVGALLIMALFSLTWHHYTGQWWALVVTLGYCIAFLLIIAYLVNRPVRWPEMDPGMRSLYVKAFGTDELTMEQRIEWLQQTNPEYFD